MEITDNRSILIGSTEFWGVPKVGQDAGFFALMLCSVRRKKFTVEQACWLLRKLNRTVT